jgi:hypothetical protein
MTDTLTQTSLNETDSLGYGFEMANLECLKGYGYGKYIVYSNPSNTYAWKRKRGYGVDLILKLGEHTYYVEEGFCSYSYKLSQSWFMKSRVSRFRDYPSDAYHHQIIVTNKPHNYSGVFFTYSNLSSILVVTIDYLLQTIRDYALSRELVKTTNNTNAYGYLLSKEDIELVEKAIKNLSSDVIYEFVRERG